MTNWVEYERQVDDRRATAYLRAYLRGDTTGCRNILSDGRIPAKAMADTIASVFGLLPGQEATATSIEALTTHLRGLLAEEFALG